MAITLNKGDQFGRLTVTGERTAVQKGSQVVPAYECTCTCGKKVTVCVYALRRGNNKSCGCLWIERSTAARIKANTKHGEAHKTVEYSTWKDINNRCHNPSNKSYFRYGGRGIQVCSEWRKDYPTFLAHVGRRPSSKHSLDRIDNNRGYEPGNVRWATVIEQQRNRRDTRHIAVGTETKTSIEWSRITGVSDRNIRKRIFEYGWPPEKAIQKFDGRAAYNKL